jgi:hypothetical protein
MARSQPFAPFRASALENEATALRAHTLAEPMRFGAPAVVRLKSSLHCDAPKVDILPLFEKDETNNRILLCQGIDTLVSSDESGGQKPLAVMDSRKVTGNQPHKP